MAGVISEMLMPVTAQGLNAKKNLDDAARIFR